MELSRRGSRDSRGVLGVPGWTEELQEDARPEGTGFSNSERSAAPDLVAGVSHISGERAGLVGAYSCDESCFWGVSQVDIMTEVQAVVTG